MNKENKIGRTKLGRSGHVCCLFVPIISAHHAFVRLSHLSSTFSFPIGHRPIWQPASIKLLSFTCYSFLLQTAYYLTRTMHIINRITVQVVYYLFGKQNCLLRILYILIQSWHLHISKFPVLLIGSKNCARYWYQTSITQIKMHFLYTSINAVTKAQNKCMPTNA